MNLGSFSSTLTHDVRLSNVKVSAVSVPALGSTQRGSVSVTFTLQSYEAETGSVNIYYSQDGETFDPATITGTTTGLSVSPNGNTHTVTWDSVQDLGGGQLFDQVVLGLCGFDGVSNDRMTRSDYFTVNNLPTTPTITSPTDGSFDKDTTRPVVFTLGSEDPGSGALLPYAQADMVDTFNSDKLVTADSSNGTDHTQFEHEIETQTLKPIPGYLIRNVTVSGATTVTYSAQTDAFTGAALPSSITDARVIVIQKADRRVFITSISNTQVQLDKSVAGGVVDGLVDLFVLSDVTADFYVESGISVTSTTPTTVTFSSMGNDDFGQDIPDTFVPGPRILVVDEADRLVILGTITTTGVDLSKSIAGGATNGSVTLFIMKTNSDIYQDTAETVSNTTLTAVEYDTLSDSGALPSYIPGAIPMSVEVADRHCYLSEPVADQAKIAKSVAGGATNGSVDWDIWTKPFGSGIWVPMSPNGIPDGYEGESARWRPESAFDEGNWYVRVAVGNE